MLGFLMTKATMIIAAMIILVSMLGFFQVQRNLMFGEEVQSIADQLAAWVNDISTLHAEVQVNITFDESLQGYVLPRVLSNGKPYDITFLQRGVVVSCDGISKSSVVFRPVHFWTVEDASYSAADIDAMDAANAKLEIEAGEDVMLVRRCIEVGYSEEWATFVCERFLTT